MFDPALAGLAGAIGGATVTQVLGYVFATRRDRAADLSGRVDKLAADLAGRIDQLAARLGQEHDLSEKERGEIRETLAFVRERVAGIEGLLNAALPPTPLERRRRGRE